jgi:DNA repair protein RecN (Recombination protein N)
VLASLHIRNLAVVAGLDVEFGSGLNVVTGETGAGKSLVLGALQLLLGERAGPGLIRQGAASCEIAASLHLAAAPAAEQRATLERFLADNGLPPAEEDALLLRRVIAATGSRAFINGAAVTLQTLRQLGDLLVDIHGPHDHQSLLQPRTQLELLDAFCGAAAERAACADAWRDFAAAKVERERLAAEHLSPQEAEFCRFQLQEIERAGLDLVEDEALPARHAVAAHRRSLLESAARARQGLTEGEAAAVEPLRLVLRELEAIEAIDAEQGAPLRERLEQMIASVEELGGDLERYASTLELDEAELARLDERLGLLQKLRRKYGPTLADVLRTAATLRERLDSADQRQARLEAQERRCAELAALHQRACAALHQRRHAAAMALAEAITGKLQRLGFQQSGFAVTLAAAEPGPDGADHAEFGFAPNPGEPMQSLRQIASSGEMARVMLAVKTVLSQADRVPVLVFDEVDANIGGRVAVKVAEEMCAIARHHQVLCISHLPQIAAAAARHYRVSKEVADGRTHTAMALLDAAGREEELTRMLGAEAASATAREHVRELLVQARQGEAPRRAPALAAGA